VHSYVFVDVLNIYAHPPSPIWKQENEVNDFEEESNQILDDFFYSSNMAEIEDEKSNLKKEHFNLLYTPYEDISTRNLRMKLRSLHHYMKEESFLDIVNESRTLEVVGDKEKINECYDWKLLIQSKTIIFLSSQELTSLNYGSRALLAK
jgi:hypothetical protein